jgi:CotH protein
MQSTCTFTTALTAITLLACPAGAQDWADVYNPLQMLQLNLELNEDDWAAIVADDTYDVDYLPALFWADSEEPMLVGVKRKSATPIGTKVSLKVDINEFEGDQRWRGLKKFRLENGDDQDVVREGLAWYIHRLASLGSGPSEISDTANSYESGFSAWINLTVYLTEYVYDEDGNLVLDENDDPETVIIETRNEGVYVHNEEHDDQFLKNRGLWIDEGTWLYKHDERGTPELKKGEGDSPAYLALDYSPFQYDNGRASSDVPPTPNDAVLYTDLEYWIDMNSMLSLAAANAFASNPDALFNHDKNAYFTDFLGSRRIYHAHDLDAAIAKPEANIYANEKTRGKTKTVYEQAAYQRVILNHPLYRQQYNDIMARLLGTDDDLTWDLRDDLIGFLNAAELLLTDALVADPNSKFGNYAEVAEEFNALRGWVEVRWASVKEQLEANQPLPRE